MTPGEFRCTHRDRATMARCGVLQTAHGAIETPVFMPVGTQGTVKAVTPDEISGLGYEIILSNTYHLNEQPGAALIERMGGLHSFMGWQGAILTDSGGYQVFSLAQLREVRDDGVAFRSHRNGAPHFLGPREAMDIQRRLGSDIAMALDVCPPYPCDRAEMEQAERRTLEWAALCREQPRASGQLVFGIVQGGVYADIRAHCAAELVAMGFDGYAIGGVSVGEPEELIRRGVADSVGHLPQDRPRYLMGVGLLPQMIEAIGNGVDMFDCVMPTRFARNGTAFTRRGRYPVKAAVYAEDKRPIEEGCGCYVCSRFSRAYVRHLIKSGEILGLRLLTMHNLYRYSAVIAEARAAICDGNFSDFRDDFLEQYRKVRDESGHE